MTAPLGFAAVFTRFLRLGLVGFGGPSAHLALFHEYFVARTGQVGAQSYARMVAMSQAIPGPGSSQVGMMIGLQLGGLAGMLAAFLGFTLPSALVMVALGLGVGEIAAGLGTAGGIALSVVVFAIVARALAGMAGQLAPDWPRRLLALTAFAAALFVPGPTVAVQLAILAGSAAAGALLLAGSSGPELPLAQPVPRWLVRLSLGLLALILALILIPWPGLPPELAAMLGLLRAGGLVFGGGHVVLPVIQADPALVAGIDAARLTTGYAAAQAVPGPVFTFAGFIGAASDSLGGIGGGLLGLALIFVPSLLMVMALAPLARAGARPGVSRALAGINAGVCGILAAALVDPIALSVLAVDGIWPQSLRLGLLLAVTALVFVARVPGWLLVLAAALTGAGITALG